MKDAGPEPAEKGPCGGSASGYGTHLVIYSKRPIKGAAGCLEHRSQQVTFPAHQEVPVYERVKNKIIIYSNNHFNKCHNEFPSAWKLLDSASHKLQAHTYTHMYTCTNAYACVCTYTPASMFIILSMWIGTALRYYTYTYTIRTEMYAINYIFIFECKICSD